MEGVEVAGRVRKGRLLQFLLRMSQSSWWAAHQSLWLHSSITYWKYCSSTPFLSTNSITYWKYYSSSFFLLTNLFYISAASPYDRLLFLRLFYWCLRLKLFRCFSESCAFLFAIVLLLFFSFFLLFDNSDTVSDLKECWILGVTCASCQCPSKLWPFSTQNSQATSCKQ